LGSESERWILMVSLFQFRMKSLDLGDVLKSFETASSRLQAQYMKAQNEVRVSLNI
jgi:hypothetical protein